MGRKFSLLLGGRLILSTDKLVPLPIHCPNKPLSQKTDFFPLIPENIKDTRLGCYDTSILRFENPGYGYFDFGFERHVRLTTQRLNLNQ